MLTANSVAATEVKIKVSNVDVDRGGNILVMIFGEEGFPKAHDKAVLTQKNSDLWEEMAFSFDLAMDEFAVKVLHDETGDGKVSKNWTGLYPREGLGFSNEQKIGVTGPPGYKSSKLRKEQIGDDGLTISIIYP